MTVHFGGQAVDASIDTGSTINLCARTFFDKIKKDKQIVKSAKPIKEFSISATGNKIQFNQSAEINFKIQHFSWTFKFFISPKLPTPVILGINFLRKSKAVINMDQHLITFPYGTSFIMAMTPYDREGTDNEVSYTVGDHLTPNQIAKTKHLMQRFPDTVTPRLDRTNLIEFDIDIRSDKVVRALSVCTSQVTSSQRTHIRDVS